MIKKFGEFINEKYGRDDIVLIERDFENGKTASNIKPEEFIEMLAADIEVAKEVFNKETGRDLKMVEWAHPADGSSTRITVLNTSADKYVDVLEECYNKDKNTNYLPKTTGWSMIYDGWDAYVEITFHTPEEALKADRKKHEDEVFKFYRGTTYFGD